MPHCILLATLNAKYSHASLGLRYLQANMLRHGGPDLHAVTALHEFTIHTPPEQVVHTLVQACGPAQAGQVAIVGLGIYIWNVVQTTEVVRQLKAQRPDIRVVLGGPEVSHEWQSQAIVGLADYLITGWGDVSFPRLCRALVHGPQPLMKVIAGEQPPLDALDLPYEFYTDDDLAHRILYVEASRGCPFKCAFCLSALDKTAWAFDVDLFLAELASLYARGARTFKFVDRTFNLKVEASVRILEFFLQSLEKAPQDPVFVHFELIPDHLPDALKACIARFAPGTLQFEIGIQSLNPEVQKAISRRQDSVRTRAHVQWLVAHSAAHLHTDLIFGLPGESWESFAQGFDTLWSWGPHEIQLGVLKRLRGTPLALTAGPNRVFAPEPPYAIESTDALDGAQVQRFVRLARYWDLVANSGRFAKTLPCLLEGPSAFAAFAQFADWLWAHTGQTSGITPEALVDALYDYLCSQKQVPPERAQALLLADYLACGARARPQALKALLSRAQRAAHTHQPVAAGHSQRQQRHAAVLPDDNTS